MMIIMTNTNNNSSRIQTTFFKQTRFFSKENPRKSRFGKPSPTKTGGKNWNSNSRPNLDLKLHNVSTILHSPGGNKHGDGGRTSHGEVGWGKNWGFFVQIFWVKNVAPIMLIWKKKMNFGGSGSKSPHLFSWKNIDTTKWVKSHSWNFRRMLIFSICQTTSWTPIICEMFVDEFINI